MLTSKQRIFSYVKNYFGWSTKRKIIVFSVDDYGNVRLASKSARGNLIKLGFDLEGNRFDKYDSLETSEDLSSLFEVLSSVKDINGQPAKFTAYALSANINFEKVLKENDGNYHYELLPETFSKLPGYEDTWQLWQEGVDRDFLEPQYHGREHLNIRYFQRGYKLKNDKLLACLNERSWSGLPKLDFEYITYTTAYSYETSSEIEKVTQLATAGLKEFREVFKRKARAFTSPGAYTHSQVEQNLIEGGIEFIDTAFIKKEHQGDGRFRLTFNRSGCKNELGQINMVRNSVFEPSLKADFDWVDRCLAEIDVSFKLGKPANISSHRVNFCGMIDSKNRAHGLKELKRLLKAILKRWPDAEFMGISDLGSFIKQTQLRK